MRDTLTKNDKKMVELMVELNIQKNIGKVLVYMRNKKEIISVEIERGTELRQPEVSIVMQWLKRKAWVSKRNIKREGKGRPVHSYKLIKPFSEIIGEIEKQEKLKILKIEKTLEDIKKLI